MVLGLLTAPSTTVRALPAAPRLLARAAAPAAGIAAGAIAGTARAGVRSVDGAVRLARVARTVLPGSAAQWRAGARAHLALRPADPDQPPDRTRRLARRLAEEVSEHPDVLFAYWDDGLDRLVVAGCEDMVGDDVIEYA
ncbi:hypothetical protein, partial [Streptomyces shenzhenensis]